DLGDLRGEPVREAHSARAEPDERQVLGAAVALEDFVGDTGEGSVERSLVEDLRLLAGAWCAHLLSLRASPGSLKGKLQRTDSSHSTWRSSLVSTPRTRRCVTGAPALDGPPVVLDRDATSLHHEPPRGQGPHDLFRSLALPHDQTAPPADGPAVVAKIEDAGRMARDRGHEVAHQVSGAHVGGDR